MTTPDKIQYLASREIDRLKWDSCIHEADNGLIYTHSFYLDIMADNWDALVLNDYEAVMPLPWNRKYGFYYLYQPYFTRALGVFGKKISAGMVHEFLNAIPKKFRYWNIDLNETNSLNNENNLHLTITTRTNYHLSMDRSYEEIYSHYRKSCKQRIKKATLREVRITREGSPADVINFYRQYYESKHPKISSGIYKRLIAASTLCFEKDQAKIYLAKLPGGEITAVKLVLLDNNYVYFLISGNSEKGKETASKYLITDAAVKDFVGSGKTFRFEGSDIPGIATFNAQFGADRCSYLHLNRNALPFPVNLLKRV